MFVTYWQHTCPACHAKFAASLDTSAVRIGPGHRICEKCGTRFADGSKEWGEMSGEERRCFLLPSEVRVCLGGWLLLTFLVVIEGWPDMSLAVTVSAGVFGFFAVLLTPFYVIWWWQIIQSKRRFRLRFSHLHRAVIDVSSRTKTGQPSGYVVPLIGLCMLAVLMLILALSPSRTHNRQSQGGSAETNVTAGKANAPRGGPRQLSNLHGDVGLRAVAPRTPTPVPASPAEAREQEIAAQDAAKPGDPELGMEYEEVNAQYFQNKLPAIPVLWEPRLGEIGPLKADGFTEKGLWATHGDKVFILLNPLFSKDAAETRRVLCHEVVHEYLHHIGDEETNHGPKFQAVLRRLSEAGAFEGIPASDGEKSSLRSWIDAESIRLGEESALIKGEEQELDQSKDAIDREADISNQEVRDLNQRISNANEQGYGWPSDDEIDSSKAKARFHDQRVVDFQGRMVHFNGLVDGYNVAITQFNHAVKRYNLMMAYPDGLDEEATMPVKTPVDRR